MEKIKNSHWVGNFKMCPGIPPISPAQKSTSRLQETVLVPGWFYSTAQYMIWYDTIRCTADRWSFSNNPMESGPCTLHIGISKNMRIFWASTILMYKYKDGLITYEEMNPGSWNSRIRFNSQYEIMPNNTFEKVTDRVKMSSYLLLLLWYM